MGAVGALMGIDREALLAWLEASCRVQEVPLLVTDAGVVSQIGVLLRGRDAAWQPRSGERGTRSSHSPGGNNPVWVDQASPSTGSGADGGEVEHSGNDRGLPSEVQ